VRGCAWCGFFFFFAGRFVSFDLGKVCQWLGCVFKAQWGGKTQAGGSGGGGRRRRRGANW